MQLFRIACFTLILKYYNFDCSIQQCPLITHYTLLCCIPAHEQYNDAISHESGCFAVYTRMRMTYSV